MTEQEMEVWAKRVARVWEVPEESVRKSPPVGKYFNPRFSLPVAQRIELFVSPFRFELVRHDIHGETMGVLSCSVETGILHYPAQIGSENHPEEFEEFSTSWGNTFRRNCWLSGANLEASSHEKAEWVQGFSREEIQAWNLSL